MRDKKTERQRPRQLRANGLPTLSAETSMEDLRVLRDLATRLNATVRTDLDLFLQNNKLTFRRLPGSNPNEVNITTTCTVQMALASNGLLEDLYGSKNSPESIKDVLQPLFEAEWQSSGLKEGNPFTPILVFRNAGFLASSIDQSGPGLLGLKKKPKGAEPAKTLREIILEIVEKPIPECFKLDWTLRENPALGYWLVDAIDRLRLPTNAGLPEKFWTGMAAWASREYTRQHSLVASHHDIMMDPVALAMAACLTERLRKIANQPQFKFGDKVKGRLPTGVELSRGLSLLFALQQPSGIWDKFFPMFYYREDEKRQPNPADHVHRGGANYCFAFEFLESILNEFGQVVARNATSLRALANACKWCEENRLSYNFNGRYYSGWNSGQQVDSLARGEPESWATGVVHMFLRRLRQVLSEAIQARILDEYGATTSKELPLAERPKSWENYLDCSLPLSDTSRNSVKKLIEREILKPLLPGEAAAAQREQWEPTIGGHTHVDLSQRRSALLFGPPGTSKTSLVEAIAERLGWPYLEITPSHFLRRGLEKIYVQANEIFEDLMDLSGVVILFDEMDALVQRREGGPERIDVTRQFLTTSMLPKLARLHKRSRVLFFMATNHQREFDPAIKRPGRFDLLVRMGPPSWEEKLRGLENWLPPQELEAVRKQLHAWGKDHAELRDMLVLFTFGEMNELLDHLRRHNPGGKVSAELANLKYDGFRALVKEWFENTITLRRSDKTRNPTYDEFEADQDAVKVQ